MMRTLVLSVPAVLAAMELPGMDQETQAPMNVDMTKYNECTDEQSRMSDAFKACLGDMDEMGPMPAVCDPHKADCFHTFIEANEKYDKECTKVMEEYARQGFHTYTDDALDLVNIFLQRRAMCYKNKDGETCMSKIAPIMEAGDGGPTCDMVKEAGCCFSTLMSFFINCDYELSFLEGSEVEDMEAGFDALKQMCPGLSTDLCPGLKDACELETDASRLIFDGAFRAFQERTLEEAPAAEETPLDLGMWAAVGGGGLFAVIAAFICYRKLCAVGEKKETESRPLISEPSYY